MEGTFRVAGADIVPVSSFKYLGFRIDASLNLGTHWAQVTGRLRGAIGSLSRLLAGHRRALRITTDAVVQGSILYYAKAAPPMLQTSWMSLERIRRYQARVVLGLGRDEGGPELLSMAELPSVRHLHSLHSLRLLYSCRFRGRRFGIWVDEAPPPSRTLRDSIGTAPIKLTVPSHPRISHLDSLFPSSATRAWNTLPLRDNGIDAMDAVSSLRSFTRALLSCLPDSFLP